MYLAFVSNVLYARVKAGDTTPDSNTKVSLHVVDTDQLDAKHRLIRPPPEYRNT